MHRKSPLYKFSSFGFAQKGFSLIELLVVIAIIGILASVAITGYQTYIDTTRDGTAKDFAQTVGNAIDADSIALENGLGGRSTLIEDTVVEDKCWQLVNELVTNTNGTNSETGQSNPFNANKGMFCDGVHAASTGNEFTIARGQTVIYCDGLDTVSHKTKLSNGINVRTCTCVEEDCTLKPLNDKRCVAQLTSAVTPSSTSVNFTLESFSPSGCIDAGTKRLYLAGDKGSLSVVSCTASSCTITSGAKDISDQSLVYVEDQGACYYPFGFSSETDFFSDLSTHSGGTYTSATDYERHICGN